MPRRPVKWRRVRWWRMRSRRKIIVTAVALLMLAGLIVADRQGWLLIPAGDDLAMYHTQSFLVAGVVDGDTVELAVVDRLTGDAGLRVRLWGIDCPELGRNDEPAEPWAAEATDLTASLCEHEIVIVHLEPHRLRDTFGRLLAHVTTRDGVNVSEALLRSGLAHVDERWRHGLMEVYRSAEREARSAHAGLWSDEPPE